MEDVPHFDLEEAVNMAYECQYHNPIHNIRPPENVDMAYIALVASYMVESRDSQPLPIVLPEANNRSKRSSEEHYQDVAELTAAWDNSERTESMQSGMLDAEFGKRGQNSCSRWSYSTDSGTTISLREEHYEADNADEARQISKHMEIPEIITTPPAAKADCDKIFSPRMADASAIVCCNAKHSISSSMPKYEQKAYSQTPNTRNKEPWTFEEIEFLNECKEFHPKWNYERIAEEINVTLNTSRTAKEVQQRWCRVENPALNKGGWLPEEDETLAQLFTTCRGSVRLIVKHIRTRTAVQVRERLHDLGYTLTEGEKK